MDANAQPRTRTWPVALAAAAILLITIGVRQTLGLYIAPINTATGIGIVAISFALAVAQLIWGVVQPIFGALAERIGSGPVLVAGALMLAAASALTPFVTSEWMLVLTLGFLSAAGAGAGSFSVLIGATTRQLPPEKRAFASGFVNAGGSLGQMIFAPLNQFLISTFGWVIGMYAMAVAALATLPLIRPLARGEAALSATPAPAATPRMTLREQLGIASRNRSYWLLHAGFFTCGFHIAFLVTHLPGEINLCSLPASVAASSIAIIGLANVFGSLTAGWLGNRFRMKWLLFWMYFSRAAAVGVYLLAPKTALTFYVFAVVLGVTWLATVPPTAGLVGKLFGVRFIGTLFGLTLVTHQVGAFFGAWLGGIALVRFGDFGWMWYADMTLALGAALVNLPIRELRVVPAQAQPAT